MSLTIIVTKHSTNRWTYKADDGVEFAVGRYDGFISSLRFQIMAKAGRLMCFCPISGVTVVDNTAGGASYNTTSFLQLYAKLDAMEWPGMLRIEGGGGGSGNNFAVIQAVYDGNPITVPNNFVVTVVQNENDALNPPSGMVAGTSFTITTNVPDLGAPLLIFGYTPA